MKNWMTTGLVYDTEINGKMVTCLLRFIGGYTEKELNEKLREAEKETGLTLRFEDCTPIETRNFTYTYK